MKCNCREPVKKEVTCFRRTVQYNAKQINACTAGRDAHVMLKMFVVVCMCVCECMCVSVCVHVCACLCVYMGITVAVYSFFFTICIVSSYIYAFVTSMLQ